MADIRSNKMISEEQIQFWLEICHRKGFLRGGEIKSPAALYYAMADTFTKSRFSERAAEVREDLVA